AGTGWLSPGPSGATRKLAEALKVSPVAVRARKTFQGATKGLFIDQFAGLLTNLEPTLERDFLQVLDATLGSLPPGDKLHPGSAADLDQYELSNAMRIGDFALRGGGR